MVIRDRESSSEHVWGIDMMNADHRYSPTTFMRPKKSADFIASMS